MLRMTYGRELVSWAFLPLMLGAIEGGTIGILEEGDEIEINAVENRISVNLPDSEIAARKAKWVRPEPRYKYGVLAKYAKLVTSASEGAVTDKNL
jgi:dihydroxy-acid dehydratase